MAQSPKDNFSAQAAAYAAFRPNYPQQLYDFLYSLPVAKDAALDCATGNGQVAGVLAQKYKQVYATDISVAQLQHAPQISNITYIHCPAEATPLPDQSINLVTVGQAVHWFDFEKFNKEVRRVLKPGGYVAIWGYGLLHTDDLHLNTLIAQFYTETVGPYWDAELSHIDQNYTSIPFPFSEIHPPKLSIDVAWTRQQIMGYLSSWSSVQHFIRHEGQSPLPGLEAQLQQLWPDAEVKKLSFPVFLRVGQV